MQIYERYLPLHCTYRLLDSVVLKNVLYTILTFLIFFFWPNNFSQELLFSRTGNRIKFRNNLFCFVQNHYFVYAKRTNWCHVNWLW